MIRTQSRTTSGGGSGARTGSVTVYVSTAGSDTQDGTSAVTPVATSQKALDLCAAMAAYSPGPFTIQLAAGTYTEPLALTYTPSLFIASPITFLGAKDGAGIPTVIVQGSTDGTRTHDFFRPTFYVRAIAQDIKFISFRAPFAAGHNAEVNYVNVHTRNCLLAISLGNMGWADVSGGDWDGRDLAGVMVPAGSGLSSVIGSFWNLEQPAGFTSATLKIHHCDRGMLGNEMGSGHMDSLWIEDCNIGVELTRGIGAPNMSGIRIWRCGIGLLGRNTPNLLISDTLDFGQGTANACTQNVVLTAGPTNAQIESTNYDSRPVYKRASANTSAWTGDIVEHTVWPMLSIVQGRMRERDLVAQMHIPGQTSGAGGLVAAATLKLKIGATTMLTMTLPVGCRIFLLAGTMTGRNSGDVQGDVVLTTWNGTATTVTPLSITTATGVVSLTADTPVALTMQLGNAADTFQLRASHCFTSIAGIAG